MNEILCRQLAIDYCCSENGILARKNQFTVHRNLEGRRRFWTGSECFLKVAVANGCLLFTGNESILSWCKENYADTDSAWFFESKSLRRLNYRLHEDGWQIETVHPFFISEEPSDARRTDCEIRWYGADAIEAFRGDERFTEAFSFCPEAPDVLGVAALRGDTLLGMAGASADSPTMWQIGINTEPCARGSGIAVTLVTLLKNAVLEKGILPFYGTSMSHIASQRVALASGFVPAWAELVTSRVKQD